MNDREKIIDALENGRVEFPSEQAEAALLRMDEKEPDFSLTGVQLETCWERRRARKRQYGFTVDWTTVSAGFGSISVFIDKDGQLRCDNEGMSKEFVKKVLCKLVDESKFLS